MLGPFGLATKCYYGETDIFAGFAIFAKHNAKNDKNNGFFKIPIGTTSIVNLQPFSILEALLGGKVQRNLVFLLFFQPGQQNNFSQPFSTYKLSTIPYQHLQPITSYLKNHSRTLTPEDKNIL